MTRFVLNLKAYPPTMRYDQKTWITWAAAYFVVYQPVWILLKGKGLKTKALDIIAEADRYTTKRFSNSHTRIYNTPDKSKACGQLFPHLLTPNRNGTRCGRNLHKLALEPVYNGWEKSSLVNYWKHLYKAIISKDGTWFHQQLRNIWSFKLNNQRSTCETGNALRTTRSVNNVRNMENQKTCTQWWCTDNVLNNKRKL